MVRVQFACSHTADMCLPHLLALSFRGGQLTVLEFDCLQETSRGTGAKHTKFLVSFMQSASSHVFLDLPILVLEMNTHLVG